MKKRLHQASQSTGLRFVFIGVLNTLIDFGILNILTQLADFDRIPANIVSASVAMTFSFLMNRRVVFKSKSSERGRQIVLFLTVTALSIYVIQNLIIFVLTEAWKWPLETLYDIVPLLSEEVFVTNVAKAAATAGSLMWNFLLYKEVVFKDLKDSNEETNN